MNLIKYQYRINTITNIFFLKNTKKVNFLAFFCFNLQSSENFKSVQNTWNYLFTLGFVSYDRHCAVNLLAALEKEPSECDHPGGIE